MGSLLGRCGWCLPWCCVAAIACGGAEKQPATPADTTAAESDASQVRSAVSATAFAEPENIGPSRFLVLGPFPAVDAAKVHQSLDHDYLRELGGEATATLAERQSITVEGQSLTVRSVEASQAIVDLVAHFQGGSSAPKSASEKPAVDTNQKIAYAYAEFEVPEAMSALALFGSDDAAAVWLNGERVHHVVADRAVDPNSDSFDVSLVKGKNRLLIKVDNGAGGWGFALRLFDEEGKQRMEARQTRRELEALDPGPRDDRYLLGDAFPKIGFRNAAAAAPVFGDTPLTVRWFGPARTPTEAPAQDGRYVALIEATTLDGFRYRRMLTFAKVPEGTTPWFPAPPMSESEPLIPIPPTVKANDAQRAEISRQIWSGGLEALRRGQSSAIAAVALYDLSRNAPPPDEPPWLSSGFVRNAEHQLALRMSLEGRTPVRLEPPQEITPKAGRLHEGKEVDAGMKPRTAHKLRKLARQWAQADPDGFVVLVARKGVVFMNEGFNGFSPDSTFFPASIGKTIAGLTFAQAVDQGLVQFDQPVASVLPEWNTEKTNAVTFRHCFNHVTGLTGHQSHGGLFNAYLDNALLIQDAVFTEPGTVFHYNGDGFNLAGRALELLTGRSTFRLLYEHVQKPFGEPVTQFDLGVGDSFTAMYLAKIGQMFIQDGAYGSYRLFSPGFVKSLYPRPIANTAPKLINKEIETGIGLTWMIDPPGDRDRGVLGPNVLGHGSGSGTMWRVDLDDQLIIVVGRNSYTDAAANDEWITKFATAVAEQIEKPPQKKAAKKAEKKPAKQPHDKAVKKAAPARSAN